MTDEAVTEQPSLEALVETGMLSLVPKILRRWGVRGVLRILRSERVFASNHLGYVLVVGFKR